MTAKEIIELIGILCVLLVGIINISVLIRQYRKSAFLTAITNERIRYTISLRTDIADFCSQVEFNDPDQKIMLLTNHIKLSLNPSYKNWDRKIIELLDSIINSHDYEFKKHLIRDLILLSQFMFNLEWQGIQKEAKTGILSKNKKKFLSNQIYEQYLNIKNEKL